MSTSAQDGGARPFRSVSIRRIANGWISSTTAGDGPSATPEERFHAKKPTLGAAKAKAPPSAKAKRTAGTLTYRDPAQRPK